MRGAFKKLMLFIIIGLMSTATYYLIAVGSARAGLSVSIAHITGLSISLVVSYLGQKKFTFDAHGKHRRYGPRFLAATGLIVLLQFALVMLLASFGLTPAVIFLASSIFYPVASFILHWGWTFRQDDIGAD